MAYCRFHVSLLILIYFVNLSCCWHPNWSAKYRKDYVTGYNAAGAVIKIAPNFTSYWDLFRASNIDTKSSNPPAQYLNLLNAKGKMLRMTPNETYDYSGLSSVWSGNIKNITWLPSERIVFSTDQNELIIKNQSNAFRRYPFPHKIQDILILNDPRETTIFYCLDEKQFGWIQADRIQQEYWAWLSSQCLNIYYGPRRTGQLPSVMIIGDKNIVFHDELRFLFDLEVELNTAHTVLYRRPDNKTEVIYTSPDGFHRADISQNKKYKIPYEEGVPRAEFTTKMVLGCNSRLNDILIVGFSTGDVWTLELENLDISTIWTKLPASGERHNSLSVRDLAFNFIQTTSPEDSHQKGEPVVIISKEFGLAYMYNLATRQAHSLRTWSGASNAHLTGNMIFVPARPDVNYTDPNYAVSSNLEIGLGHGRVWQLLNVDFLQVTPSEAQSHIFTRRVFNNHKSNPLLPYEFYGYYQKKIGWNWAAITRSIIRFYWPQTILPSLCEINNLFSESGMDCCLPFKTKNQIEEKSLLSSSKNMQPLCVLGAIKATNALLLALNLYEIPFLRTPTLPSFFRIQSEITNNNLVVIKMIDINDSSFVHFVIIFGFEKASNPKRFDLDKLIIWDPNEESRYAGVTHMFYEEFTNLYHYSMHRYLKAYETTYFRVQ